MSKLPAWVEQSPDIRAIYGALRKYRSYLPSFDKLDDKEILALARMVRGLHRFCGDTYVRHKKKS